MEDICKPESLTAKFNFDIEPDIWDNHEGFDRRHLNIFIENDLLTNPNVSQENINNIINAINCALNKIECECLRSKALLTNFSITYSSLEGQCSDAFACTVNNRINIIYSNIFYGGDIGKDLCILIYHELMHTIDDCESCFDQQLSREIDQITDDFYRKFHNQIKVIEKEIIDTIFDNEQIKELLDSLRAKQYNIQTIDEYIRKKISNLNSRFFENASEFRAYANEFCVKGIAAVISDYLYFEFTNSMPELEDFERSINSIVLDIVTNIYQKYFQEDFNKYCRMINELRTGGCSTNGLAMEFELRLKPVGPVITNGDFIINTKYSVNLIIKAQNNSCCRKTEGGIGISNVATVTLCSRCPKKCIFYYESFINDTKYMSCLIETAFMGCDFCIGDGRTPGTEMNTIHKIKQSIMTDFDNAIFNSLAFLFPGLVKNIENCPC